VVAITEAGRPVQAIESGIMSELDRRIRRTRRLMTDALIALTLEKGYEAVSIRDITERAGIGYATFFRHYRDKEALLGDVLEAMLEELMALVQPSSSVTDPRTTGRLVFTHAQQNGALYRVLLASRGSSDLLRRVQEIGVQGVLDTYHERPNSPVPIEIAANHIIASFLALIDWWLKRDMPYPPERMGEIYAALIIEPTRTVVFA